MQTISKIKLKSINPNMSCSNCCTTLENASFLNTCFHWN